MQLNSWLQTIGARRWPILPATLVRLHEVCARHIDLIRITELANLTLSDPLLTFDLIRVIGKSRALQRSESMPTVEQAMILMGLETVIHRFVMLLPLDSEIPPHPPAINEEITQCLARSRVAALIVKDWLSLAGEHKIEECYIAALIYNLPVCFFLLSNHSLPPGPLLQQVSHYFNVDYPKLLEQFVSTIPLPVGLMHILSTQERIGKRKTLLRLAVGSANSLTDGYWRAPWQAGIDTAARLIGVDYATAYSSITRAVTQVARQGRSQAYSYPARELIMLPPSAAPLQRSIDEILRCTITTLSQGLPCQRALFLAYDSSNHSLKLAAQRGLDSTHPLYTTAVSLEPDSFFALFSSKVQSLHATASMRRALEERYQDAFFHWMAGDEFAAMTLFHEQDLIGVFYIDQGPAGGVITAEQYQRFKAKVMESVAV